MLAKNPNAQGRVTVNLVIAPSGAVSAASPSGALPEVGACVAKEMSKLEFAPSDGSSKVSYPIQFSPS